MRKARLHQNYGGACGGGAIRAGSLLPVTLTPHVSPPNWLASVVVIIFFSKGIRSWPLK
ncbi:hypothetical protein C5810_000950 [Salmonella enterica subsp. enterica serovar Monschaui]|nr:hypothetical protein [Salmonella enterica subsp. enterica serovar Monschaui]EDX6061566.1 hypothetical protein [Salmonella enterica subsp. enterica serovar Monschaui]EEG0213548.1 hypothetical protein [Salmonella enterica]